MNHLLLFTEKDNEILSYYHQDKDLYKLSSGEIKEKIKASILLYDIKGA